MIIAISLAEKDSSPIIADVKRDIPEILHGVIVAWPKGTRYVLLTGSVEDIAAILPQQVGVDIFKREGIDYKYPSFMEQELVKEEAATQRLRLNFLASRQSTLQRA